MGKVENFVDVVNKFSHDDEYCDVKDGDGGQLKSRRLCGLLLIFKTVSRSIS